MPANKNALIRYKTIDNCLRNKYRRWTLQDLVEACSDALYEMEGIVKGVSVRTVQADIQMMRSDKLGYNAPIEVYDHKYYRYEDDEYSITNMPLSQNDYEMLQEAVDMLRQLEDFDGFNQMSDLMSRLQDSLAIGRDNRSPIVHFDSVPDLRGLKLLTPLYNHIQHRRTLRIQYQSFTARQPVEFIICPYLLKEYRNRWFLFGGRKPDLILYNLALDRMIKIEETDAPYEKHPSFDGEHFFDDVIGVTKDIDSRPRKIRFMATAAQAPYIETKPLHSSQRRIGTSPIDRSSIFEIEVVVNYEMYSLFMSYGDGIKIISPRDVASYMRKHLAAAAKLYE